MSNQTDKQNASLLGKRSQH